MKAKLGTPIGTRELRELGSSERVVLVRLWKPRRAADRDWKCPYHIKGLGAARVEYAYGVDAIQALVLALEGIRVKLEKSGRSLMWVTEELGNTGFTRFVPIHFGLELSNRLHRMIDKEMERFAAAKAKAAKAKAAKAGTDSKAAPYVSRRSPARSSR